jgi:hypothetical protein
MDKIFENISILVHMIPDDDKDKIKIKCTSDICSNIIKKIDQSVLNLLTISDKNDQNYIEDNIDIMCRLKTVLTNK